MNRDLNWTNPDNDTSFMDPLPSKSECGGISVGRKISVMHRPECWSGDVTCEEWPGHEYDVLHPYMHYSEYDKMLHFSYTTYLKSEDGDALTFDWEDFIEDAKEVKVERDLNDKIIPYIV